MEETKNDTKKFSTLYNTYFIQSKKKKHKIEGGPLQFADIINRYNEKEYKLPKSVFSKNIFNESSNIESTTYDQIFQSKIKKHQRQFQSMLSQKKQRDKMPKYKCEICSKFYDAIGETEPICLDCSRHRTNLKVQNTPEDFYSLDI